jgi:hemerythrin superfamily protein
MYNAGVLNMEIYQHLINDHDELIDLLDELINLDVNDDYRYVMVEEIRNLLVPHSRAEESVFYNTLRSVNANGSLIRHGYMEHLEAEAMLRTLQVKDRFDLNWKTTAIKLRDGMKKHIREEESEIFAEAKNIFTSAEAVLMGEAFEALKPQIQREGFFKNSLDLVLNMMPPRVSDKIRHIE